MNSTDQPTRNHPSEPLPADARKAGPLRRIGALVYDLLAVLALCLLAGFVPVLLNGGALTTDDGLLYALYLIYNLTLGIGYFVISWRLKHCTLGMKAWRLELVDLSGRPFRWSQLLLRAVVGILAWLPLGLGVWWQYLSASGGTWHDIASDTRIVVLKKRPR